ncbi:acyl-CoA dehydrogenase family protein [Actinoplanes sp. NPDC020271]|uniref:acyl-CoA dehydrogenase family protein n=1 Tax=Actinoplanes sp. NPDC020271 TaxID=3363896 RepID=UPI0037B0D28C
MTLESLGLDEVSAFPVAACAALDEAGLPAYYVPVSLGGRLDGLSTLIARLRETAATDLTVAVAHGKTFLGAVSVWLAGDPGQAARLARHVLAGEAVAWGLTEEGIGSDLLAGTVSATRTSEGWRLDGRKWPINNATRGRFMCVLARTAEGGGPRGFSLFLVDKHALPPGATRPVAKVPTHGIRGADISGLEFVAAPLPADALVGTVGGGLETVLKALQWTRTACSALSLGAADHGLALARRYLSERRLYDRRLGDLPHARAGAGEGVARLFLAEVVATTAARATQAAPGELSVLAAIAKAFVPSVVHEQLRQLGDLLGARGFLTGVEGYGEFAKLERDHQIVGIFDGSTWVNRSALVTSLPAVSRLLERDADPGGPPAWLNLDAPLPVLDPSALRLAPAGESIVRALPGVVAGLERDGSLPPDVLATAHRLVAATRAVRDELRTIRPAAGLPPTAVMRLAERYEWCFAGAAAVSLWAANPQRHALPWWRSGLWLRGALSLVLAHLTGTPVDSFDLLAERLLSPDGAAATLLTRGSGVA